MRRCNSAAGGFAIAAGMWNPESLSGQAHGTAPRFIGAGLAMAKQTRTGHRRRTRTLEVTA